VHASLTVFVNGERKGASIWDGKAWDGSRIEGRRWVTGLHIFGTSPASSDSVSNMQVSTGRLQDSDTLQIVFAMLNISAGATAPSSANHDRAAGLIREAACAGGDASSAWDCLAPQAAGILAGWTLGSCDGLVAADKLEYTAMQLRRKTETGETVKVSNVYRASDAPAGCGNSIYGAYHAGVEWKFWAGPASCSGPLPDFSKGGSLLDQLNKAKVVPCPTVLVTCNSLP